MAIQGYTPGEQKIVNTVQSIYGPGSNNSILSAMLAVLGMGEGGPMTTEEAQFWMSDIIKKANASGYPNLLDEDGKLDIGLLYPTANTPPIWQEFDIIGVPDGTFHAMIIDGKWVVIANQDAYVNIMLQMSQNVPTYIEPPQIEWVSQSGFGVGIDWVTGATFPVSVINFCATFYTKYGETTQSNILMSPMTHDMAWSARIRLSKAPHSLVKAIYFYRTFNGQFRRVKELIVV